jgi:hypothetical protein
VRRKKRVRLHLITPDRAELPSVEGLLVSRRRREYLIALPELLIDAQANPAQLDSKWLAIPRERVAFYEILR